MIEEREGLFSPEYDEYDFGVNAVYYRYLPNGAVITMEDGTVYQGTRFLFSATGMPRFCTDDETALRKFFLEEHLVEVTVH